MPIIVPNGLPVADILRDQDGIHVMEEDIAVHQNIRTQEYAVLNLMPSQVKLRTARQLARLLGHTSLQINLTLLNIDPDSENDEHLSSFIEPWESFQHKQFEGLIITGANIENLDWKDVRYWDQLRRTIDWSRKNVTTRIAICWGAQAMLHHLYGHEKKPLDQKAFGVFPHTLETDDHPLVNGLDDEFLVPVSRHTEMPLEDLYANDHLTVLSTSADTGAYIAADKNGRDIYIFNHPEYGKSSLGGEYFRDVAAQKPINVPVNYFRNDDPQQPPVNRWRTHARALWANILDQTYQRTEFERSDIINLPENLPYRKSGSQS
jgi:homoserine O-succinyltransferase/O-acetyltransferase